LVSGVAFFTDGVFVREARRLIKKDDERLTEDAEQLMEDAKRLTQDNGRLAEDDERLVEDCVLMFLCAISAGLSAPLR
jgi:hypothetical protein